MKNNNNYDTDLNGLVAIANDLANFINTRKNFLDKSSDFIAKAIKVFLNYNDIDLLKKAFFIRVGNTTLYNKLQVVDYFDAFDICFKYNVKLDTLKVYGKENLKTIDKSLKQWKQQQQQQKKIDNASLTTLDRMEKLKSRLSDDEKQALLSLLKSK